MRGRGTTIDEHLVPAHSRSHANLRPFDRLRVVPSSVEGTRPLTSAERGEEY